MNLRKELTDEINGYQKKVLLKQKELREVNEQMCSTFGHEFTPWEGISDPYYARPYCYERICITCGKKDRIFREQYMALEDKGLSYVHKK